MKYCLSPRDFPRAQAIFHRIPRLESQYSHSQLPNNVMFPIKHIHLHLHPLLRPLGARHLPQVVVLMVVVLAVVVVVVLAVAVVVVVIVVVVVVVVVVLVMLAQQIAAQ